MNTSLASVGERSSNKGTAVLLQTSRTKLSSPINAEVSADVQLLLDVGSQKSYITHKLSENLALPILRKEKILIKTFGDERAKLTTCNVVQLCVECADGLNVYIDAYVVPLICSPVTNQCIEFARKNYPHLTDLPLADNSTGETSFEIELLIRANHYYSLVLGQTV